MHRWVGGIVLAALVALAATPAAARRVALVIGNGSYVTLSSLDNPTRDAAAIAGVLRAQGFDVSAYENLERAEFLDALEDFRADAAGAEVAVIFYGGHGMEVAGKNVVAPVDMEIACDTRETRRAVPLEALFASVAGAQNQIVLLDSCRNDPFPACPTRAARSGSGFRGISLVEAPQGALLIANATLPGSLAEDGPPGDHSPFAEALLERFRTDAGQPVAALVNAVAADVSRRTAGRQVPEIITRGGAPAVCLAAEGCSDGGSAAALARRIEELERLLEQRQAALPPPVPEPVPPVVTIAPADPSGTLAEVRARGMLACGVNTGLQGFSAPDATGRWTGLDADTCRAIAAAVLGDGEKVRFVPLSARERFTAVQAGEVDVLVRNTSYSVTRDTELGLRFVRANFIDGQAFMLPKALGVSSALDLSGASVCVQAGTTTELNVANYFAEHKLDMNPVTMERFDDVVAAYRNGRCDVITAEASALYMLRLQMPNAEDHAVLPELITDDRLGPYVRADDGGWLAIVRSVLDLLVLAEAKGATAEQVAAMRGPRDDAFARPFGEATRRGVALGLTDDWAYRVIRAVGNYGEVFDRNLGPGSPFKMSRGVNALVSRGGLMPIPSDL